MDILEQYTVGKATTTPSEDSEDAVVVTAYYAAVIDGATPKTAFRYSNGETPGKQASRLLGNAILDLNPMLEVQSAIAQLNRVLYRPDVVAANRPTASIVIYSKYRNEIWMVGDCQFGIICKDTDQTSKLQTFTNPKRIDRILAEWRRDIDKSIIDRGLHTQVEIANNDPGRRIIQPFITQQVRYQNIETEHPLAYGVMDGETIPSRFVRCFQLDSNVEQIILATDGYPVLFPTLQETEDELSRLLSLDPLCLGPLLGTKGVRPGNSSYDDRTYLRLKL